MGYSHIIVTISMRLTSSGKRLLVVQCNIYNHIENAFCNPVIKKLKRSYNYQINYNFIFLAFSSSQLFILTATVLLAYFSCLHTFGASKYFFINLVFEELK